MYNWPQHTHMAMAGGKVVAVAVSKLEKHREYFRGYVAMLAVDNSLRGKVRHPSSYILQSTRAAPRLPLSALTRAGIYVASEQEPRMASEQEPRMALACGVA